MRPSGRAVASPMPEDCSSRSWCNSSYQYFVKVTTLFIGPPSIRSSDASDIPVGYIAPDINACYIH